MFGSFLCVGPSLDHAVFDPLVLDSERVEAIRGRINARRKIPGIKAPGDTRLEMLHFFVRRVGVEGLTFFVFSISDHYGGSGCWARWIGPGVTQSHQTTESCILASLQTNPPTAAHNRSLERRNRPKSSNLGPKAATRARASLQSPQ